MAKSSKQSRCTVVD